MFFFCQNKNKCPGIWSVQDKVNDGCTQQTDLSNLVVWFIYSTNSVFPSHSMLFEVLKTLPSAFMA